MSIGFSGSDVVLCVRFAHKLWKEAKDAPNDFQNIVTEVANFKLVLDEVQESIAERELDQRKRTELAELINGCTGVLNDLQSLLDKYKSLATQSKRTWDRLRFGKEPIETIRSRLISHTTLLMTFRSGLYGGSLARIEKLLEQLALEHSSGLRETSVITAHSIESAEEGDEYVWSEMSRELEDVGITISMVVEHKGFIIQWMKRALLVDGKFDEVTPTQSNTTAREHPVESRVAEGTLLEVLVWQISGRYHDYGRTEFRKKHTFLTIPEKIDPGVTPPDFLFDVAIDSDLSGFGDKAKSPKSNTKTPVTAVPAFKSALYNTLSNENSNGDVRRFLVHPKYQIKNIDSGRHLSFDAERGRRSPVTLQFFPACNASVIPCWRVAECRSGSYRLFADLEVEAQLYASLTAVSYREVVEAKSKSAIKTQSPSWATEPPWWTVHEWSLDCVGWSLDSMGQEVPNLFKIRPAGLNLGLGVDANMKLQLSLVEDCDSQVFAFSPPDTADLKSSQRFSPEYQKNPYPHQPERCNHF